MPIIPTDATKACKIISHQGGGLYVIEVLYDDTPRTDRMAEIDKLLIDPKFTAELAFLQNDWEIERGIWQAWIALANDKIFDVNNAYISGNAEAIKSTEKALRDVVTEGLKARDRMIRSRVGYERALAQKTALDVERLALFRASSGTNPLPEVWCIDLADGQNGRAIYANNSLVPLVCLNYDTNKYLLPPLNLIPTFQGGTGLKYEIAPLGVYNRMDKYRPHDAAGFKFWNCAMEPGFAKWQPILMQGVIVKTNSTCSGGSSIERKVKVRFNFGEKSRFGLDLPFGTFDLDVVYFNGAKAFVDGDLVVCNVIITEEKQKQKVFIGTYNGNPFSENRIISVLKITGDVIGFVDNPKIDYTTSGCTLANSRIDFSIVTTKNGISETAKNTRNHGYVIFEYVGGFGLGDAPVIEIFQEKNIDSFIAYIESSSGVPSLLGGCSLPYKYLSGQINSIFKWYGQFGSYKKNEIREQSYLIVGNVYIPVDYYEFEEASISPSAWYQKWTLIKAGLISKIIALNNTIVYIEETSVANIMFNGILTFSFHSTKIQKTIDCSGQSGEIVQIDTLTNETNGTDPTVNYDPATEQIFNFMACGNTGLLYGSTVPCNTSGPLTINFDQTTSVPAGTSASYVVSWN